MCVFHPLHVIWGQGWGWEILSCSERFLLQRGADTEKEKREMDGWKGVREECNVKGRARDGESLDTAESRLRFSPVLSRPPPLLGWTGLVQSYMKIETNFSGWSQTPLWQGKFGIPLVFLGMCPLGFQGGKVGLSEWICTVFRGIMRLCDSFNSRNNIPCPVSNSLKWEWSHAPW